MNDKLEELKKKRDQLNVRIKKEQSREAAKKRKQQTQAKILIGSALLNRINSEDEKAKELYQWCRNALTEKDQQRLDQNIQIQVNQTKSSTPFPLLEQSGVES